MATLDDRLPRYGAPYGGGTLLPDRTGYEGMGLGQFFQMLGGQAVGAAQNLDTYLRSAAGAPVVYSAAGAGRGLLNPPVVSPAASVPTAAAPAGPPAAGAGRGLLNPPVVNPAVSRVAQPKVKTPAVVPAVSGSPGARPDDVQVIRGLESTFATPELGYSNELSPEMYFGSLLAGGDLKQAAALQRLGMLPPESIRADATVEAARIREVGGTEQAGIAAGAQNLATRTQRETEILKLLGTPVQGGGELASDPSNPLLPPVAVPTFQRRILLPGGGFEFAPMGASAARKAGAKVPGQIYTDAKGNRAVYQADGTFKEVK